MLTSVPWLVVLVGAGLLATLLVFAMLSFRPPEHRAAPPPAPPLYLPTLPPSASASPSPAGRDEAVAEPVVTPSAQASPSPSAASSPTTTSPSAVRPSASAEAPVVLGAAGSSGALTARYQVVGTDRGSFDAQLRLDNGSDQAQQWQVELAFAGNVKSATALSPGISVTASGGAYLLRGTSALAAGQSTTVTVRFLRNGAGDRPGRCTVDGTACTIG
ncbi:hypothetical protein AB0H57_29770 [Micromonospora sp. NPDC050686]|uniref:hypothetical protein n=1 Tax=Micromonospora sp. NPDC050686 TaxID=3154631 RepID=UPI0033C6B39A